MANHDRVNELYFGKIYNEDLQRKTRERIHWICKNVIGEKILDIGCSQGITSILLGRENFLVTGLDIEKEAIEYAINELSREEIEVQQRVHFIHANALTYDFRSHFDTVILAEVIEHLVQPKRIYDKVWHVLNESGRVIITTPFGINDHIDHKTTYYFSNLLEEIHPYFQAQQVEIIGRWICLFAEKRPTVLDEELSHINSELVKKSEQAFYAIERQLLENIKEKNVQITQLKDQLKRESTEKTKIIQKLETEKKELIKKLNDEIQLTKQLKDELQSLKKKGKEVKSEGRELKKHEKDLVQYNQALEKAVKERDKNIRWLRNRVTVLEQSLTHRIHSLLMSSLRKPWLFPKHGYQILRLVGGGIKRKVLKQKKKYKLVKLPYKLSPIPASFSRGMGKDNQKMHTVSMDTGFGYSLNELFLIGLKDAPQKITELRVASIFDDFSYQSFRPDCRLITFRPDNWREILTLEQPHILFVESAWKGNGGSWQYKIAKYNIDQGNELEALLDWCHEHRIPTVFWNKEDPIHFEKFIDTAKKFDYIYTTDEMCIPRYKEYVSHENVYALPFAAQPKIHNPIQVKGYKEKNICFAGSYYANRHPDRKKDLEEILDAARPYGLEIYDRNYEARGKGTDHFRFPDRFEPYIVGSLPYHQLVQAYKKYKVFLNVNSVQESKTMFSRRVFELLACGTSVVSTYAKGITHTFGDLIPMTQKGEKASELINNVLQDEEWRTKMELEGQRNIFEKHTYAHRLYEVAKNCGFDLDKPYQFQVCVLTYIENTDQAFKVYQQFNEQNYGNLKLTIFYPENKVEFPNDEFVNTHLVPISNINEMDDYVNILNEDSDYITFFKPSNFYGPYFITDLLIATTYSEADVIGKADYFAYDSEHSTIKLHGEQGSYVYTSFIQSDACLIDVNILTQYNIDLSDIWNCTNVLQEARRFGLKMFSINPYQFVRGIDEHLNRVNAAELDKVIR